MSENVSISLIYDIYVYYKNMIDTQYIHTHTHTHTHIYINTMYTYTYFYFTTV